MQSNEATLLLGGSDRKPRVEFQTVSESVSVSDLAPEDCVLKLEMVTVQRAIYPII